MMRLPGLLLALFLAPAVAGPLQERVRECDACHGEGGNAEDPRVPSIAGFSEISLEEILLQYQGGARPAEPYRLPDGEETDMARIARKLTRDEIRQLAAHYAARSWRPRRQPFDAELAKRGEAVHLRLCDQCHSEGGANPDDDSALLAGQGRTYLERQFELIRDGKRSMPRKMRSRMRRLESGDVEALVEYYVSRR